jgi:hypothetical protein
MIARSFLGTNLLVDHSNSSCEMSFCLEDQKAPQPPRAPSWGFFLLGVSVGGLPGILNLSADVASWPFSTDIAARANVGFEGELRK